MTINTHSQLSMHTHSLFRCLSRVAIGLLLSAPAHAQWVHSTVSTLGPTENVSMVVVAEYGNALWFSYSAVDWVNNTNRLYLREATLAGMGPEYLVSSRLDGVLIKYAPSIVVTANTVHILAHDAGPIPSAIGEQIEYDFDKALATVSDRYTNYYQANNTYGYHKSLQMILAYHNGVEDRIRACTTVQIGAIDLNGDGLTEEDEVYCAERALSDTSVTAWSDPLENPTDSASLDQDHASAVIVGTDPVTIWSGFATNQRGIYIDWHDSVTDTLMSATPGHHDKPSATTYNGRIYVAFQYEDAAGNQRIQLGSCDDSYAMCFAWSIQNVSTGGLRAQHPSIAMGAMGDTYVVYRQGPALVMAAACEASPNWNHMVLTNTGDPSINATKYPIAISGGKVHVVYRQVVAGQRVVRWSRSPQLTCP